MNNLDANTILKGFKPDKRHSLAILQEFQKQFGYISADNLKQIAAYLDIPISELFSMATFYKALSLDKNCKFIIKVCDGTACHIRGSVIILEEIKNALGIKEFETTPDGFFSLEVVNCVGSCAMAPVVVCNDEYFGNAKKGDGEKIIKKYREVKDHE
jgi:NADH:ubiquinone oxidoreductase subunit E